MLGRWDRLVIPHIVLFCFCFNNNSSNFCFQVVNLFFILSSSLYGSQGSCCVIYLLYVTFLCSKIEPLFCMFLYSIYYYHHFLFIIGICHHPWYTMVGYGGCLLYLIIIIIYFGRKLYVCNAIVLHAIVEHEAGVSQLRGFNSRSR